MCDGFAIELAFNAMREGVFVEFLTSNCVGLRNAEREGREDYGKADLLKRTRFTKPGREEPCLWFTVAVDLPTP